MITKIHNFYRNRLFPKVSNIRGSTRLKIILEKLATRNLDKINQKDIKDIFKEDWDGIILIDSCRQDLFQEVTGREGYRISKASNTPGYIRKNFSDGSYEDIVYISANPQFGNERFQQLTGRDPEEVFHTIFQPFYDSWEQKEETIKGEPVIRDLKTAKKLFPDKKLFIHFLQPHHPFFLKEFNSAGMKQDFTKDEETAKDIWTKAEENKVQREEVIEGYKRNIGYIDEFIEEAKELMEGRLFITSDHGNFIGEAGMYGHPKNRKEKALRKVPWVEVKK